MRQSTLLLLTLSIAATSFVAAQGDGKTRGAKKRRDGVEVRRIGGGYGTEEGKGGEGKGGEDKGGEDAADGKRRAPKKADKKPKKKASRPGAVASVLLPTIGSYRAPKILRLAGKLTGLEVRVATRTLNDTVIQVPRQLAKRHVGLTEIKLLLAAHKLFLVEWDHPEYGPLLVATDQADWEPAPREFKHILDVHPSIFDQTWKMISDEIERRNAKLPSAASRYAAMPVPRLGKIYVWAPTPKGLEEVVRLPQRVDVAREKSRLQIATYKAKHQRVDKLKEALLAKLTEGEKKRVRIAAGTWSNVLLIRGTDKMIAAVQARLEKLDQPKKGRRR